MDIDLSSYIVGVLAGMIAGAYSMIALYLFLVNK